MPTEQLLLLPLEAPPLPLPFPPPLAAAATQAIADLLLQVVTSEPQDAATQEVANEVLR
ncbi:MAG: hypothetical protein ABIO70_05925 [Pseudomonadota bacterium]